MHLTCVVNDVFSRIQTAGLGILVEVILGSTPDGVVTLWGSKERAVVLVHPLGVPEEASAQKHRSHFVAIRHLAVEV